MNDIPTLNLPLLNSLFQQTVQHVPLIEEKADSIRNKLNIEFGEQIKDKPDLILKFDKISVTLFKMGIPPSLVINSFFAFRYKSIEEALEILEKDSDELWLHKFIESDDGNCYVCNEKEEKHRLLSIVLTNRYSDVQNRENLELKKKLSLRNDSKKIQFVDVSVSEGTDVKLKINVKNCEICWTELDNKQKLYLNCNHEFCRECIIEYINEEIKNSRVIDIKCPTVGCKELFTDEFIKNIVTNEEYNKYKKFLVREKIKDNPNYITCPIVNCEGYADISNTSIQAKNNEILASPVSVNEPFKKEIEVKAHKDKKNSKDQILSFEIDNSNVKKDANLLIKSNNKNSLDTDSQIKLNILFFHFDVWLINNIKINLTICI